MNRIRSLSLALLALFSGSALAQQYGLQVAETATPKPVGSAEVTAGVHAGDFSNVVGLRGTYGWTQEISVFGEASLIDPDVGDGGFSFGLGTTIALLNDLPFDNGIRLAAHFPILDDTDAYSLSAQGVFSGGFEALPDATFYGALGLTYSQFEIDFLLVDDTEAKFLASGGVFYTLNQATSIYGEISYLDDLFAGVGLRWTFE